MYKIHSDKIGDYLISLPQSGFPTITIKSPQFAMEVMLGLQKVLREKFPCPDCDRDGYAEGEVCWACDGIGIHIPESEV